MNLIKILYENFIVEDEEELSKNIATYLKQEN
jgi:hypothetical protein